MSNSYRVTTLCMYCETLAFLKLQKLSVILPLISQKHLISDLGVINGVKAKPDGTKTNEQLNGPIIIASEFFSCSPFSLILVEGSRN